MATAPQQQQQNSTSSGLDTQLVPVSVLISSIIATATGTCLFTIFGLLLITHRHKILRRCRDRRPTEAAVKEERPAMNRAPEGFGTRAPLASTPPANNLVVATFESRILLLLTPPPSQTNTLNYFRLSLGVSLSPLSLLARSSSKHSRSAVSTAHHLAASCATYHPPARIS
ncbi:hypothetical protein VTJ04DRAFT_5087 [Mycothermus thermophilus]|uniref:uncharacterized protein n=1 Tax=Humicola insolens TaxID=85995 RepID=UPI003742CCDA